MRVRTILGLVAIAVFFLCFKPIIALTQYPAFDDWAYLSRTADLLHLSYPRSLESSYPPGVAIAWLPAALIALVYSWLFQLPEVVTLPIFVGLSSYAYWCASLFLLAALIKAGRLTAGSPARLAVESLVALLGVPVLYYSTHRTTMVHAPEFFIAVLTAFYVVKKRPAQALVAATVLFLLRLNDLPVLLFALAPAIEATGSSPRVKRATLVAASLLLVAGLAYVVWLGFVAGYNRFNFTPLVTGFSIRRVPAVLFAGDWGLLWTAPAWLLCLIIGVVRLRRSSMASRFAVLWMLSELTMILVWPGNGSDFAYRYLIGSYAGALVIALEVSRDGDLVRVKNAICTLWTVSACWLTWVTWIYKERPEFTPYYTLDRMWTHPELMWNSLKALLSLDHYLLPWPHSTLGALYYSWVQPQGPFALPGGSAGVKFQVMSVVCGVLLLCAAWLATRLRRRGESVW